jgi:hypothetical protein
MSSQTDRYRRARRAVPLEVSNTMLIAAAAVVALIAYPLLQPEWVMVK